MFKIEKVTEFYINKEICPSYYKYVELSDGTNHCVLTEKYVEQYAERIKNFEVFPDDIWVITFPKCGTTWTQEIVWLLNNDLDYEVEKTSKLDERFPFLELGGIVGQPIDTVERSLNLARPRHIKSHLPVFLLPSQLWTVKPKIIYVSRNPKDAAVSYYHHYRHMVGYTATKADFFNVFLNDKLLHSPMNQQVLEFWNIRNEPNILFLFYEDMIRNLKPEVDKIMKFLGKSYSGNQINKLCQHVSFDSMKNNPSCNRDDRVKMLKTVFNLPSKDEQFSFIRKGKTGSYREEMSKEEQEKFDQYIDYEGFKDAGFSYKLE